MAEYLFVYGTLMKAAGHPMAVHLAANARHAGPARFRGKLYRVAHYPGAVASKNAADEVHGELYELRNPARLFEVLDAYEGCSPGDPEPTKYVRVLGSVNAGGSAVSTWIYLYNWPLDGLAQIASGRFLASE
jgi:gamma-glutamylcyclotransferase (GGCT)/AIG2-like uncharacterized protein YtfP